MPISTMEKIQFLLLTKKVVVLVWCPVKRQIFFSAEDGGGQQCGCTRDVLLRLERVKDVVCEFEDLRISRLTADSVVITEASAMNFNELFFACWSVAENCCPVYERAVAAEESDQFVAKGTDTDLFSVFQDEDTSPRVAE